MRIALALAALVLASPALAQEVEDDGGTLNPDEMSLNRTIALAEEGGVGMVICAQGYLVTKSGRHVDARKIFRTCADADVIIPIAVDVAEICNPQTNPESNIVLRLDPDQREAVGSVERCNVERGRGPIFRAVDRDVDGLCGGPVG